MKTSFIKSTLSFVFAFSFLFLMSCEKDNPGGGGGGGEEPGTEECVTYGTFTRVICGVSIYDNYWILLDNGKFLQPCETDVVTQYTASEGMRIKFGYKRITGPSSCDDKITCAAIDPRVKSSRKVRITCLQIESIPTCQCESDGVVRYDQSCNVKYIETADHTAYEPIQGELDAYAVGQEIKFSFVLLETFAATCTGAAGVHITCIIAKGDPQPEVCRPLVIGDDPRVPPVPSGINVLNARIEGNCLKLKLGFSGCDASTDRISLMWDGIIGGFAPTATLVLIDEQPQTCTAYFTKEVSCDLSPIKQKEPGTTSIFIAGWEGSLVY